MISAVGGAPSRLPCVCVALALLLLAALSVSPARRLLVVPSAEERSWFPIDIGIPSLFGGGEPEVAAAPAVAGEARGTSIDEIVAEQAEMKEDIAALVQSTREIMQFVGMVLPPPPPPPSAPTPPPPPPLPPPPAPPPPRHQHRRRTSTSTYPVTVLGLTPTSCSRTTKSTSWTSRATTCLLQAPT